MSSKDLLFGDAIAVGYSPAELRLVGISPNRSERCVAGVRPWQGPVPSPRMSPPLTVGDAIARARRIHLAPVRLPVRNSSGPAISPDFLPTPIPSELMHSQTQPDLQPNPCPPALPSFPVLNESAETGVNGKVLPVACSGVNGQDLPAACSGVNGQVWHDTGKVDARVNFLLDDQKTDTEKYAPVANIDKAFESPHTHSSCYTFLRQYSEDSFSKAACMVAPKSIISYPQVWQGQGSRKWKLEQSDGFFVQFESPILQKIWFVPSSVEKGRPGEHCAGGLSPWTLVSMKFFLVYSKKLLERQTNS